MASAQLADFSSKLFANIVDDDSMAALVGDAVFDEMLPNEILPSIYVQIGEGKLRQRLGSAHYGQEYLFEVNLFARSEYFSILPQASTALQDAVLKSSYGQDELRNLQFTDARIYRLDGGALKKMAHQFRAYFDLT